MPIDGAAGDVSAFSAQFQTMFLDRMGQTDQAGQAGRTGQAGRAHETRKAETVGTGNADGTSAGQAPDPSQAMSPATGGAIIVAAMMSLAALMPPMQSSDDVDAKLASIEAKMKDTNNGIDKGEITMNQQQKLAALAEKKSNLEDASAKSDKAAGEHKQMSKWDKAKLAFSYIGAILTIAVGIIAIATSPLDGGLGLVAGGLLIAGGAMMLMMAIDQTMQDVPGKDGQPGKGFVQMTADSITKAMYPNDPEKQQAEAAKWALGLNMALMGASILCTIVGSVVNPTGVEALATELPEMAADAEEAASGASEVASTASEVEETASDTSEVASTAGDAQEAASGATDTASDGKTASSSANSAKTAVTATSRSKTVVGVTEGVNDAANAGVDTGSQTYSYLADKNTAAATKDNAANKALEAMSDMIDASLDALMARMKSDGERFNNVLATLIDASKDHGESLAHVRYRA